MKLQSLQSIDELIRDAIATLQETNQLENTYIFFASDNGYHQGQHRLWGGKACYFAATHYEHVVTHGVVDILFSSFFFPFVGLSLKASPYDIDIRFPLMVRVSSFSLPTFLVFSRAISTH